MSSDRFKRQILDAARLAAVQGVLDLASTAGTLHADPDAIWPHCNGYSTWFTAPDADGLWLGTAPLTAKEILARIDKRAAAKYGSSPSREVLRMAGVVASLRRARRLLCEVERCAVCGGSGAIAGFWLGTVKTCPACHGKGRR